MHAYISITNRISVGDEVSLRQLGRSATPAPTPAQASFSLLHGLGHLFLSIHQPIKTI
jgi:hypothetical protein